MFIVHEKIWDAYNSTCIRSYICMHTHVSTRIATHTHEYTLHGKQIIVQISFITFSVSLKGLYVCIIILHNNYFMLLNSNHLCYSTIKMPLGHMHIQLLWTLFCSYVHRQLSCLAYISGKA